jgi:DNA (cytosine-5)-methyltransferase 1
VPTLLDLYCGAGGCSVGYRRAGFDCIVGVDVNPQPRYPFAFVRADAIEYVKRYGDRFDAIHASPPCQRYCSLNAVWGNAHRHPDLVDATREALLATGRPYVIENVPRSPLRGAVCLCGSSFGLGVRRHRLFETNWLVGDYPPACDHAGQGRVFGVYGRPGGNSLRDYHRRGRGGALRGSTQDWREAMGIDWMTGDELSQAIPPAFTQWVGERLLKHLGGA